MPFAKIEEAVAAIGHGEIVVVVDDEDRENEGDLIMAAEFVTPEKIAFFLHHTSGYICAPITSERARELDLDAMVTQNTESQRTAFLVSVDFRHGTSTRSSSAAWHRHPSPRSSASSSASCSSRCSTASSTSRSCAVTCRARKTCSCACTASA